MPEEVVPVNSRIPFNFSCLLSTPPITLIDTKENASYLTEKEQVSNEGKRWRMLDPYSA